MASPEWQEIYRSYDAQELADEIDSLKKEKSNLTSQSMGSKSYTQDLAEIRDKLHAAVRIQNERKTGTASNPRVGFADFSNN